MTTISSRFLAPLVLLLFILLAPTAHANCFGGGGSCGISLDLSGSVMVSAAPNPINSGDTSTITWWDFFANQCTSDFTSTYVDGSSNPYCAGMFGGNCAAGDNGFSGGTGVVSPPATKTYTVTCKDTFSNGAKLVTGSVTVNVNNGSSVGGSCSVSPATINIGQSATWTVQPSGGTSTTGTWQYVETDVTDYSCPVSADKLQTTHGATPDCGVANPTGTSCNPTQSNQCKTNSLSACNVNTDIYACQATGPGSYTYSWTGTDGLSGSTQSVSKSYSSVGAKYAAVTITSGGQSSTVLCDGDVNPADGVLTVSSASLSASCAAIPASVLTNQNVNFTSAVSGGSGHYSYSWNDAGGVFGNNSTANKSYSSPGTKTITLTVIDNGPTPTASLSASPTSIVSGNSSTLTWGSTNATSCTGTGFATGNAPSGSVSVSPTTNTSYSVTCTGAAGSSAPASASVTVTAPPAATASLSASPTSIVAGGSSTLTWGSTNATSCTGTGFATGNAKSGSVSVSPAATTGYSVTCTGAGGSSSPASVTVTVTSGGGGGGGGGGQQQL